MTEGNVMGIFSVIVVTWVLGLNGNLENLLSWSIHVASIARASGDFFLLQVLDGLISALNISASSPARLVDWSVKFPPVRACKFTSRLYQIASCIT